MKVVVLIIFSIITFVYDIKSNDVLYGDIDKRELFAHALYNKTKQQFLLKLTDGGELKEKIINHTFTNSLSFYRHKYEKNEIKQEQLEKKINKLHRLLKKLKNGPLETVIAKYNQKIGNKLQRQLQKHLDIHLPNQESGPMTEIDDLDFQRAVNEACGDQRLRSRLEKKSLPLTKEYIVHVFETVKLAFRVILQRDDIENMKRQCDSLNTIINLLMNQLITPDDIKNVYRHSLESEDSIN